MTLVVLAAGIGSRFGGIKQLTPLTREGEYILDFTVADAMRAGFDDVIFVIRRDIEALFEERIGVRMRQKGVKYSYAYQENELPEGYVFPAERKKPLGTVQALLSIGKRDEPFAVVNADDFYGSEPLSLVADFLRRGTGEWCSIGYRLKNTLSQNGTVSRGICRTDAKGYLTDIVECKKIASDGTAAWNQEPNGSHTPLSMDDAVSMTCFGFTPALLDALERLFAHFLEEHGDDLSSCEFILAEALRTLIAEGARVRVLPTDAEWCGVTYREDAPVFAKFIENLRAMGMYT